MRKELFCRRNVHCDNPFPTNIASTLDDLLSWQIKFQMNMIKTYCHFKDILKFNLNINMQHTYTNTGCQPTQMTQFKLSK